MIATGASPTHAQKNRQRMPGRGRQTHAFGEHLHGFDAVPDQKRTDKTDIDLTRAERLHLVAGHHLLQRQIDIRQFRLTCRHQARDEIVSGCGGEADPDRAGFPERHFLGERRGSFRQPQDPARLDEKPLSRRR